MEHNTNDSVGLSGSLGASNPDRLSEAALAAIAGLSRLDDADRQAALLALGIAEVRRPWTPRVIGALPTLTELVEDRDREAIYRSDVWKTGYKPFWEMTAYVGQCPGLRRLSADLDGLPLAKARTAALGKVGRRHGQLGREEYGGWYRATRGYVHEPGFDNFTPAPRLQLARQHPLSLVRLSSFGIVVRLQKNLRPNVFEARLNDKLHPVRLQIIADTDAGRELCARMGVDPMRLRRFYEVGTSYKSASEITVIRPQADLGALAKICQDIVIDAVLGVRHWRPVR